MNTRNSMIAAPATDRIDIDAEYFDRLMAERAELIAALRDHQAIDERKLKATERRPYAIGVSTIRERVERNRALLARLDAKGDA